MRRLIFVALFFLIPSAAGASQDDAVPESPAPSATLGQFGSGCIVGGITGATLSMIGTFGGAILPATNLGCLIGMVAAPPIADYYNWWVLRGTGTELQAKRRPDG